MQISLDNEFLGTIALLLLAIFLLFAIGGLSLGVVRGFRRSGKCFLKSVILMSISFMLTPMIVSAIYSAPMQIFGNLLQKHLGEFVIAPDSTLFFNILSSMMLDTELLEVFIKVLIINIFTLYFIYFMLKWLLWVFKRLFIDPECKRKVKKKSGRPEGIFFGGLIGMAQGIVFFFILMLPVNGLLGISTRVVEYEPLSSFESQSISTSEITTSETEYDGLLSGALDVLGAFNDSIALYTDTIGLFGLDHLSNWAFDYQMNFSFAGISTSLSNELVKLVHLDADSKYLVPIYEKVVDEIEVVYNNDSMNSLEKIVSVFSTLDHSDYEILRYFVDKIFDVEALGLANIFIERLDELLAAGLSTSEIIWEEENSTSNTVYSDSIYGLLIRNFASEGKESLFLESTRSFVKKISEIKIETLREDFLTSIDFCEEMFTTKIISIKSKRPMSIAQALVEPDLQIMEYFDLISDYIIIDSAYLDEKYDAMTTPVDMLISTILELDGFELLLEVEVDNILRSSNILENIRPKLEELFFNDQYIVNLLYAIIEEFIFSIVGPEAIGTAEEPGIWLRMRDSLNQMLKLLVEHQGIIDGLNPYYNPRVPSVNILRLVDTLAEYKNHNNLVNPYERIDDFSFLLYQVVHYMPEVAAAISKTIFNFEDPLTEIEKYFLGDIMKKAELILNPETSSHEQIKEMMRAVVDLAEIAADKDLPIRRIVDIDFLTWGNLSSSEELFMDKLAVMYGLTYTVNEEGTIVLDHSIEELILNDIPGFVTSEFCQDVLDIAERIFSTPSIIELFNYNRFPFTLIDIVFLAADVVEGYAKLVDDLESLFYPY